MVIPPFQLRPSLHAGIAAVALGCSSPGAPTEAPDAGLSADVVNPPPAIAWSGCELNSGTKGGAECAIVDVPLDYGNPSGLTMQVAVKRVVPTGTPRAHLWLVDGGPGGSVLNAFTALARKVLTLRNDIVVYGVDHRGAGGSHPLDCPKEEAASSPGGSIITDAEWGSCVSELKTREAAYLPHLTTSNAMRDLAHLIERTREPNVWVLVHGGSYGTYAVTRFMKLFPKQADGIILEGIAPPGRHFDLYDTEMNAAAKKLFDECKANTSCKTHLGADPWAAASSLVASFDTGHCPTLNLNADGARAFLGGYTFFRPILEYIPILVYRMKRCETRDVAAIVKFYKTIAGAMSFDEHGLAFNDGKRDTKALFFHVALSEMWHWDGPPDPTQVLATWRQGTMSTGLTVGLAKRQADWPVYARGPEVDSNLPPYDGPILMLQGALDAATPIEHAVRLRDAYRGANQTWVEFPTGSHMIIESTPTLSGEDCGRRVMFQFLDNPKAAIDSGCANALAPVNFDGASEVNKRLLGVTDGWDG